MERRTADLIDRLKSWYARECETANYDAFIRFLAFAYFALLIFLQIRSIIDIRAIEAASPGLAACTLAARGMALLTIGIFAVLTLARLKPVARAEGALPRAVAVAGAGALFALVFLERAPPAIGWDAASAILIAIGNALTLVVVLNLGRSFSTMAEARRLVVAGPYRYVRHPLYLAEEIVVLGMLLQYRSATAVLVLFVQFGLQLWRMHYEESVLTRAFPEYRAYAGKTARILPAVY